MFEYLDHDLWGLHERIQKTNHDAPMPVSMAKSLAQQMLAGLQHCHSQNILHRDLKASNLLISRDGVLKLADFGLARPYVSASGRVGELTYRVCTLWYRCVHWQRYTTLFSGHAALGAPSLPALYPLTSLLFSNCDHQARDKHAAGVGRALHLVLFAATCPSCICCRPPELLLGSQSYGPEVDIWSAGCILYEMLAAKPLFGGNSEGAMRSRIMDMLGPMDWTGSDRIPAAQHLKQYDPFSVVSSPSVQHLMHKRVHVHDHVA